LNHTGPLPPRLAVSLPPALFVFTAAASLAYVCVGAEARFV
jgi:hypothetical protein